MRQLGTLYLFSNIKKCNCQVHASHSNHCNIKSHLTKTVEMFPLSTWYSFGTVNHSLPPSLSLSLIHCQFSDKKLINAKSDQECMHEVSVFTLLYLTACSLLVDTTVAAKGWCTIKYFHKQTRGICTNIIRPIKAVLWL